MRPVSKVKRVPQRTCVGCRQVEGKRGLVRVVRTPAGEILVDPTGKKSGRGAYVHPETACVQAALSGQRLGRVLKVNIPPDAAERLRADLEHQVARADLLTQMATGRGESGAAAKPGPRPRGASRR